jgi:hypothetical protein
LFARRGGGGEIEKVILVVVGRVVVGEGLVFLCVAEEEDSRS